MARLIYTAITSLDGYVADKNGNFDWAAPDEEMHRFVNDLEWRARAYLYGRRMYEVMAFWEAPHTLADQPAFIKDHPAIWQAAGKIVYSKTLRAATSSSERSRSGSSLKASTASSRSWVGCSCSSSARPPSTS